MIKYYSTLFLCKNLEQTAKFYQEIGFNVEVANDAVRIKFGDFRLAFIDENKTTIINDLDIKSRGAGMYMYFKVDNVDSFYQKLKVNNVTILAEPKSQPWGKREFIVRDPDGYRLVFFSNI